MSVLSLSTWTASDDQSKEERCQNYLEIVELGYEILALESDLSENAGPSSPVGSHERELLSDSRTTKDKPTQA